MIRPVLYVDLPGIIYAIDRRTRGKQHEFANFVCWLEPVEHRILLPPILRNIFSVNARSRTWICEDHWHILGFAQVRERPSRITWDLAYLASMVNSSIPGDEVLIALLEYILEIASSRGILRIFAKVEDEIPELELFQKAGFQRYARELTYVFEPESIRWRRCWTVVKNLLNYTSARCARCHLSSPGGMKATYATLAFV